MTDKKSNAEKPSTKAAPAKKAVKKKAATARKATADQERREDLIEQGAELAPEPTPEQIAEHKRRRDITDRLEAIEDEMRSHQDAIDALRDESKKLLLDLYPQQGESDPLTTAVAGYLKAAARDREARVSQPAKLAKLLEQARLAPVDAAMRRGKQRGTARPKRATKTG